MILFSSPGPSPSKALRGSVVKILMCRCGRSGAASFSAADGPTSSSLLPRLLCMLGGKPERCSPGHKEQEVSLRILAILAVSLFLGACTESMGEGAGPRQIGSVLDPFCAPDGSVVRLQFPNAQGSFDGAMASRENCPWNQ